MVVAQEEVFSRRLRRQTQTADTVCLRQDLEKLLKTPASRGSIPYDGIKHGERTLLCIMAFVCGRRRESAVRFLISLFKSEA